MNSNSATSLYSYETSHELSSVDGNGIANGVSYYIKKSDNPAIFGYCLPQQISFAANTLYSVHNYEIMRPKPCRQCSA